MKPMQNVEVVITDSAAQEIRKAMGRENKPNAGLRISGALSACCGMRYALDIEDAPRESDLVRESNGIKIFVDEYTAPALGRSEIDYAESVGFVIKALPPE